MNTQREATWEGLQCPPSLPPGVAGPEAAWEDCWARRAGLGRASQQGKAGAGEW